jgi:hypothetical protein
MREARLKIFIPLFVFALSAAAAGADAQDPGSAGQQDPGSYQMMRQGSGFVRLNGKTGVMSYCRIVTGNLVCRPAAEEREAYLEALDQLGERLEDAEERLSMLERPGLEKPDGGATDSPQAENRQPKADEDATHDDIDLERELGKATRLAGRVIRRFFEVVQEFRHDLETRSE